MKYPLDRQFDFRLSFIISLCCVFILFIFFGFYLVEYEGLIIGFLSGSLTPGMPFRSVYFSGNLVVSQVYSLLYQILPGVEWISWLENLWIFLSGMLSLQLLHIMLPEKFSAFKKILLMAVLYFLVFADHHVHLIYTRIAYLVCGSSLLSILIYFNDAGSIKKHRGWFLLLNLFFATGTFIRNEAAIACFLLLFLFALCYLHRPSRAFLLMLVPLLIVGGQSLFFALDIQYASDKEFYKQVEPDIEEQFIARENLVPLSYMKTQRDTVMYQMAAEMALSDPRLMTPAYLRSLILPEKFLFTDLRQWNRAAGELKNFFLKYWVLTLLVFILSIAHAIQFRFLEPQKSRVFYWIFAFSFWVLVTVQAYVDKVNERSVIPLMGIFLACHFLLLAKSIRTGYSRKLVPVLGIAAMLFLAHLYLLKRESVRLENDLQTHIRQFEAVKKLAAEKTLVINSSVLDLVFLSNRPFQLFDFSAFKKIYLTDAYIIPFLPYYKRYLESECSCAIYAYPSFWKYLNTLEPDVVIVSAEQRFAVINNYLGTIHGLHLKPEEITPDGIKEGEWKAYLLRK